MEILEAWKTLVKSVFHCKHGEKRKGKSPLGVIFDLDPVSTMCGHVGGAPKAEANSFATRYDKHPVRALVGSRTVSTVYAARFASSEFAAALQISLRASPAKSGEMGVDAPW